MATFGPRLCKKIAMLILSVFCVAILSSCGGQSCVGYGGYLSAPTCYDGWSKSACQDHQAKEVNASEWVHYRKSCDSMGFTEECMRNVFRTPGTCD